MLRRIRISLKNPKWERLQFRIPRIQCRRVLFCKIQVRPRYCRSYPLWRPWQLWKFTNTRVQEKLNSNDPIINLSTIPHPHMTTSLPLNPLNHNMRFIITPFVPNVQCAEPAELYRTLASWESNLAPALFLAGKLWPPPVNCTSPQPLSKNKRVCSFPQIQLPTQNPAQKSAVAKNKFHPVISCNFTKFYCCMGQHAIY